MKIMKGKLWKKDKEGLIQIDTSHRQIERQTDRQTDRRWVTNPFITHFLLRFHEKLSCWKSGSGLDDWKRRRLLGKSGIDADPCTSAESLQYDPLFFSFVDWDPMQFFSFLLVLSCLYVILLLFLLFFLFSLIIFLIIITIIISIIVIIITAIITVSIIIIKRDGISKVMAGRTGRNTGNR